MSPILLISTIIKGKQIGRTLGFPTANLESSKLDFRLIPTGIYAGFIQIEGIKNRYKAAVSVGQNLTFDQTNYTVEAYILDFDQDIYDKKVELTLSFKIREMQKFESMESLIEAINSDVKQIREMNFNALDL